LSKTQNMFWQLVRCAVCRDTHR